VNLEQAEGVQRCVEAELVWLLADGGVRCTACCRR